MVFLLCAGPIVLLLINNGGGGRTASTIEEGGVAPRNCFVQSLVGVSLPIVVVCGLFVRCGSHCIAC